MTAQRRIRKDIDARFRSLAMFKSDASLERRRKIQNFSHTGGVSAEIWTDHLPCTRAQTNCYVRIPAHFTPEHRVIRTYRQSKHGVPYSGIHYALSSFFVVFSPKTVGEVNCCNGIAASCLIFSSLQHRLKSITVYLGSELQSSCNDPSRFPPLASISRRSGQSILHEMQYENH